MINLPQGWQRLRGTGYGQRMPVLLARLSAQAGGAWLGDFDRWMAQTFSAEAEGAVPNDHSTLGVVARLLYWCSAVQRHGGLPVFDPGHVVATHPQHLNEHLVALPYASPHAVPKVLQWVAAAIDLAASGGQQALERDGQARVAGIEAEMRRWRVCTSNDFWFQSAASAADIPVSVVAPGTFAYGQGRYARWLASSATDATPHVAWVLCDKAYTATALRRLGLPGAEHFQVTTPDEAVEAAQRLGYPVVVKPTNRTNGRGVAVGLRNASDVRRAFEDARALSDRLVVERHFDGRDFRLTVFQGRVLKVVERVPGSVVGDGQSCVTELVQRRLTDADIQRRSRELGHGVLALDDEALEVLSQQQLSPADVPAEGVRVYLRRRANTSAGGNTQFIAPDRIHPDNLRLATHAAQALALDLAGVDLLLPDPERSWLDTGALVCEVNIQPALGSTHLLGLYADILRSLVGTKGRIPIVLLLGTVADARQVRQWLQTRTRSQVRVAYASREGLWENHERVAGPQDNAFRAAVAAIANPRATAAVVHMTVDELLADGLPFDRCDAVLMLSQVADAARRLPELWPMALSHVPLWVAMPQVQAQDIPPAALLAQAGSTVQRANSAEKAWQLVLNLINVR